MRKYSKYKKYSCHRKTLNPYIVLAIFMVTIILMSIGYSAFSAVLNIYGTANANYTVCTINYVLDGGTNPSNTITSFKLLSDNNPLPIPTKTGHYFDGWYLDTNFSDTPITTTIAIDVGDVINNEVTLYAKWEGSLTYTITYELNGGTQAVNQITTYTRGVPQTLLEPTKTGFLFEGWYDNSSFTGSAITSTSVLVGDAVLYAKWIKIYTITYVLNGGIQASNQVTSFIQGQNLTILNPTKAGHDFDGWYDNGSFSGNAIDSTTGLTGDITLHAKWIKTVDFVVEGNGSTVTVATDRISSGNPITVTELLDMTFSGANIADKTINRIDVNITYTTTTGSAQSINCILTSGNYTSSQTVSFRGKQNNATATASFTGLNIGVHDSFVITSERNNLTNSNIKISGESITVYFNN